MSRADVKRLGLILSRQAELEGMIAANWERKMTNKSPAYSEEVFFQLARELEELVNQIEVENETENH